MCVHCQLFNIMFIIGIAPDNGYTTTGMIVYT